MTQKEISGGVAHTLPADLKKALSADKKALAKWEDITPLSRNEWICWVEFVKKAETRADHVKRTVSELKEGMRRPCCWLGCPHRTDKKLSPTQKWVLGKKAKSN
ncbi:MAG TPA: YdeI/OmpD-associated family protein [Candidatus Saccharimonadales bacterium]|nr:YdeI/OmpD-associated family protein [Candidatus Saccharimonadales bacterium]